MIKLEELFEKLLLLIIKNHASDVHFVLKEEKLEISLRTPVGILNSKEKFSFSLFHYLKYISNLDLGNASKPQSGNFSYLWNKTEFYFRFSYIRTNNIQTAVLRVLNNHQSLALQSLSKIKKQNDIFKKWCHFRSGLTIISGPTGSGKTTTLHAILENISQENKLKVISLEDPVEIQSDTYLQLQINEKMNFDYEEGIKQLLRHDPDVIMIGEVRDQQTAKSLIRCALSGHMVFTTLHAKSCKEALMRLLDLGVKENDLREVLTALTNQRIFASKNKKGRVCVYEVVEKDEIEEYFKNQHFTAKHKDIFDEIKASVSQGYISKAQAQQDISI